MAKLNAYIPIDRRFALTRDEPLPDRAKGAVLFADISGFSSIASALEQELGPRQGADELMMQVNLLYTGVVGEVHRYGGSVIGFSGDSMTCWFDQQLPVGANLLNAPGNSAQRATACALAMQEVVGRAEAWRQADGNIGTGTRPGAGTRPAPTLSIKVAVVAGGVRRFLSGSPEIQFIEILAGGLLDRSAAAEQVLQPGQVVVGAEVLGRFGRQLEVSEWVEGSNGEYFALVSGLAEAVTPRIDALDQTLPSDVMSGLALQFQKALFHDGLGGDAGMVNPGQPQGIVSTHPVPAGEKVLHHPVDGMTHVQCSGDIGERHHDHVRCLPRPGSGGERSGIQPALVILVLGCGGIVLCGDLGRHGLANNSCILPPYSR